MLLDYYKLSNISFRLYSGKIFISRVLTNRQYTVIINSMEVRQYYIEELCELTGFTRRTIRYYIQEGLIPPPAGRGRGGFYNDSHVDKLMQIKSFQERGLNLATIAGLIKKEELNTVENIRNIWVRYEIVPGMEISISRDLEETSRRKIEEIIKVARLLLEENIDDGQ